MLPKLFSVSLPVIQYAEHLNASREKLYRALTLSNLVALHIKSGIGRLSAFCGAVCAAGRVGREGMLETDSVILRIMTE